MAAAGGREQKQGQVALEAIVVVSFILLLMTPLLYTLYKRVLDVQAELQILEAVRAADTMAATVSMVGMTGRNSSAAVGIMLPDNVKSVKIGDVGTGSSPREIVVVIGTALGDVEIVRVLPSPFSVTGQVQARKGQQELRVVYPEAGLPIVVG